MRRVLVTGAEGFIGKNLRLALGRESGTEIIGVDLGTAAAVLELDNGNVLADVEVADLGDFFVGERTRVWIPVAMKTVVSVPATAIATRAGVDYVKLADGTDVPVIIGQHFDDKGTPAVEILSGLGQGDTVVTP